MKLLLFDIKNMLRSNIIILSGVIILFAVSCITFRNAAAFSIEKINTENKIHNQDAPGISQNVNTPDYILNLFGGVGAADTKNKNNKISIPAMYIALMVVFTLLSTRYLFSDISFFSINKSKSRTRWIMSKVVCNLIIVLLVYLTGVAFAAVFGGNIWSYNEELDIYRFKIEFCNASFVETVKLIAVMALSTFVISNIQFIFSMYFHFIVGVISSIVVYILSIFSTLIIYLGNGVMMRRSEYFITGGFHLESVALLDVLILAAELALILFKAKKMDILKHPSD